MAMLISNQRPLPCDSARIDFRTLPNLAISAHPSRLRRRCFTGIFRSSARVAARLVNAGARVTSERRHPSLEEVFVGAGSNVLDGLFFAVGVSRQSGGLDAEERHPEGLPIVDALSLCQAWHVALSQPGACLSRSTKGTDAALMFSRSYASRTRKGKVAR